VKQWAGKEQIRRAWKRKTNIGKWIAFDSNHDDDDDENGGEAVTFEQPIKEQKKKKKKLGSHMETFEKWLHSTGRQIEICFTFLSQKHGWLWERNKVITGAQNKCKCALVKGGPAAVRNEMKRSNKWSSWSRTQLESRTRPEVTWKARNKIRKTSVLAFEGRCFDRSEPQAKSGNEEEEGELTCSIETSGDRVQKSVLRSQQSFASRHFDAKAAGDSDPLAISRPAAAGGWKLDSGRTTMIIGRDDWAAQRSPSDDRKRTAEGSDDRRHARRRVRNARSSNWL
jgi:hypothetical protein